MKTIEEIEKEYEEYEIENTFDTDLDNFSVSMETSIVITEKERKKIQKEIKKNNRSQKLTRLRNNFPYLFQKREVNIYEEDNQILEKMIELILSQKEKYERASSIVMDKNLIELTRLVDFSCEYYNQHVDYLESRREALIYFYQGFTYHDGKCQNNIAVFDEFFDKKMSEYSEEKSNVKKKIK